MKKSYAKSSGENHDFSSHKSEISSCIFPIFHLTFKNWIFLKCISCAHLDCYLLTRGEQANKSLDTILSTEYGLSIYEVAFEFPYSIFCASCNCPFWSQGAQDTTVEPGSTVQHKMNILGVTTAYYLSFLNF